MAHREHLLRINYRFIKSLLLLFGEIGADRAVDRNLVVRERPVRSVFPRSKIIVAA
jgi:hypothetical protein